MSGPGRFPSEFRANSRQIPSKHPKPLHSLVVQCKESPWLADNKEHICPWGETDHAKNLACTVASTINTELFPSALRSLSLSVLHN